MLKELCSKYNFELFEYPYYVVIKTKLGAWKFNPTEYPFRLYHRPIIMKGGHGKICRNKNDGFHNQNKKFTKIIDMIDYINNHDRKIGGR